MHCLIVDDDPLICDLLQHFCSKVDHISNLTITNSGFESVNLIGKNNFDLILLDYDLPDITGKDILKLVKPNTAVVMITAYKEFASESYNYDQIVDFLIKPIEFTRFIKSIERARNYIKSTPTGNYLFVKDGNKLTQVDLSSVLFIKSSGNYAELVFDQKKVLTLMTLKELEQKLPAYFQRVHRSYIVNVNKIESISSNDITIKDAEISIGASFEKDLMKKISLLS